MHSPASTELVQADLSDLSTLEQTWTTKIAPHLQAANNIIFINNTGSLGSLSLLTNLTTWLLLKDYLAKVRFCQDKLCLLKTARATLWD